MKRMIEKFDIAGYCRISVDEELDRDNTSIENQKAIIADFVREKFPDSTLTFYEDRDRSGYTFEQREGYQAMRREPMGHQKDILIIKDFSRFSRRNGRGPETVSIVAPSLSPWGKTWIIPTTTIG